MRTDEQHFNKVLKTQDVDYVIASDTDSIYLNMGPLLKVYTREERKLLKALSRSLIRCEMELEKYIDRCYQELADYVNAYDQKMFMKRENIAERGIWTAKSDTFSTYGTVKVFAMKNPN